ALCPVLQPGRPPRARHERDAGRQEALTGKLRRSGPTYSADGRMILLSACCSSTWAAWPATRLAAKSGVNRSVGTPRYVYTDAEYRSTFGYNAFSSNTVRSAASVIAYQFGSPASSEKSCEIRLRMIARGSYARYSGCPKPYSFSFRSSSPRTSSGVRSAEPNFANSFIAASFAPPCNGPLSAEIPATIAPCRSAPVPATTRAVNVDAFISCSA